MASESGAPVEAAGMGPAVGLMLDLLDKGGPAIWAILGLSVVALALILWKLWALFAVGAWHRRAVEAAVLRWQAGDHAGGLAAARAGRGACAALVAVAMQGLAGGAADREQAAAETARVAKRILGDAQTGLRGLELIATIAPLLGLFGTVLGMISAFQALETAGASAEASALAGGIWEALLTTAAGMAVAIPVSAALTWYESVIDRLRLDMEDLAGRVFNASGAVETAPIGVAAQAGHAVDAAE
ncbi:MotA/TolQ/ExbB proton channel family protein [Paralimibaculum aggregatum]|uniref:MotA/TolQ/ExbB proton channel family protein n=1 Tax=Paralimibaculum aggregatum TaxID=3036245 RepID=A0ABQ6LU71_9RHOB|nr:MotA/TolQ/ExbB proton channel family protein [Limibaculum sp. NKW23]GMG85653.1 MotA/TolQ/ExbB proton channel family protein [Limibaculum sp. NKW23]